MSGDGAMNRNIKSIRLFDLQDCYCISWVVSMRIGTYILDVFTRFKYDFRKVKHKPSDESIWWAEQIEDSVGVLKSLYSSSDIVGRWLW